MCGRPLRNAAFRSSRSPGFQAFQRAFIAARPASTASRASRGAGSGSSSSIGEPNSTRSSRTIARLGTTTKPAAQPSHARRSMFGDAAISSAARSAVSAASARSRSRCSAVIGGAASARRCCRASDSISRTQRRQAQRADVLRRRQEAVRQRAQRRRVLARMRVGDALHLRGRVGLEHVDQLAHQRRLAGVLHRAQVFEARGVDRHFAEARFEAARRLFGAAERVGEVAQLDRLGQVAVHAGFEAGFAVAGHRVGGHRDDARQALRPAPAHDRARGLQAVDLGHLDVHQHDVVVLPRDLLDGLCAVGGDIGAVAEVLQQSHDDALVDRVVFGDEHAQRLRRCGRRAARRRRRCARPRR